MDKYYSAKAWRNKNGRYGANYYDIYSRRARNKIQRLKVKDMIFKKRDLTGANLEGANLTGANLTGALLEGVIGYKKP